jgi:tetratricopeptide (TPR) repeat protein
VIDINPSYGNAYLGLGDVSSELGRKEDAIKYYKKAHEMNPHLS